MLCKLPKLDNIAYTGTLGNYLNFKPQKESVKRFKNKSACKLKLLIK